MSAIREQIVPPRRWAELRGAVAALAFLTRVPVGRRLSLDGDDVARAGPSFPLVGAGLGAVVGGIAVGLATPLSPLVAAGLALAAGTLLTGALHLDALADTADALGARSRDHALDIMRDHAIGAYGAVAIALDLLVKAAAIATLARDGQVLAFAVAAGALSRAVPVPLAAALPYARPREGLARSLAASAWARAAAAAAIAILIAVLATGLDGLILAACAAILAVSLGAAFARWLGGITGDTLGAAVELTELAMLVAAVALAGGR
ncbi:MAG TPA: adenosylcobinamide-GDP ribazoletransferase [Solirubrobacterales bacterium]|nr:adenosylcobinamide-GDP ribazoletransferase [Solirubrobacterales bacterium]